MTSQHKQRLALTSMILVGVCIAVGLLLIAVSQNLEAFFTPEQIVNGAAKEHKNFRVGGMVTEGSVKRLEDGITVEFGLHDTVSEITVRYTGILPDLFREGQGVISLGALSHEGVFVADEVLAKHDETYMPPEVAAAMKPKFNNDNKEL